MIVDTFAGPGGWDEGLRLLGRSDVIGVEWDKAACDTATTAGHARIWGDVAAIRPVDVALIWGIVNGFIASPPCQAWSMAGARKGELDRANCHRLADRMAQGDDTLEWTEWEDNRSPLVTQPVRWVRDLQPEWVALEEVPAVLGLWEHFARIYRAWGYNVWTGVLNAADYGVPQTRQRAILMAHRNRPVAPPEPTHAEHETPGDLFGGTGRAKWVSMAEALKWGMTERPYPTIACSRDSGGPDKEEVGGSGARKNIYAERDAGRWLDKPEDWEMGDVRNKNGCVRPADAPAPTLTSSMDNGNFQWREKVREEVAPRVNNQSGTEFDLAWPCDRPAPVLACRELVTMPGANANRFNGSTKSRNDGIRVSIEEAGVLQSFPVDYPWHGTKTKQYQQVGNAIPPLLAAHVLKALGVGEFASAEERAA